MANLGNRTRKQQVLTYLHQNPDQWIDGPELANEIVGGSEGLRRLRELIEDGHPIETRRHPSSDRDIWQYRLLTPHVSPLRQPAITEAVERQADGRYVYIPAQAEVELVERDAETPIPLYKYDQLPRRVDFGTSAICPRCKAKTQRYSFAKVDGQRHKDPIKEKTPCIGCNGWGIVPNVGPIA